MQFSQEHNNSAYVIKACTDDFIRIVCPVTPEMVAEAENEPDKINELRHVNIAQSLIISVEEIKSPWPPRSVDELSQEHIGMILGFNPEVVIIGTGKALTWPKVHILQPLIDRHIGYEVMTTMAACRTDNVLMHEDRRVTAALMI